MNDILAQIIPTLRLLGFKGSGQNYRKITSEAVMIVNFQKSSGGDRFYVNLGVQPMFVPNETGGDADPQQIKEYDCMFRRRLSPPADMLGWPYDMNLPMVNELSSQIVSAYENYLCPLAEVPGPITALTPDEFKTQGSDSIFGGAHSGNALNFARIALAHKDPVRARLFAELGLASCPPLASGLRAKLKKVFQMSEGC